MRYEEDYESTQAVSPTFNAFHERLARDVVARFDLHGKRGGRDRLRPGRVRHHARRAGRESRATASIGCIRDPGRRGQGDVRQGLLRRALRPPAPGLRLLQDDARARPRYRRDAAERTAHDRRSARDGGAVHDPGGDADPEAARVLGHLLRALLVLEPRLAGARLPDRRLRSDRRLDRLRRSVRADRGAARHGHEPDPCERGAARGARRRGRELRRSRHRGPGALARLARASASRRPKDRAVGRRLQGGGVPHHPRSQGRHRLRGRHQPAPPRHLHRRHRPTDRRRPRSSPSTAPTSSWS